MSARDRCKGNHGNQTAGVAEDVFRNCLMREELLSVPICPASLSHTHTHTLETLTWQMILPFSVRYLFFAEWTLTGRLHQ